MQATTYRQDQARRRDSTAIVAMMSYGRLGWVGLDDMCTTTRIKLSTIRLIRG